MRTQGLAIRPRNRPHAIGRVTPPLRPSGIARSAETSRLEIVRDPLRILLFVLTVLDISRVHQQSAVVAKLRPVLLLVMAAGIYIYLNPRSVARGNVLKLWPMRLVAILGLLACASAAFGISLGRSASFIQDSYAKTVVYSLLLAVSIRHVRDLYTLVWAYVISCGILSFLALFVVHMSVASGSYVARLDGMHTYDSNDLGLVITVGMPLALLLFAGATRLQRVILLVILVAVAATMARSGSRGGFLGFAAVGISALVLVKTVSAARRTIFFVGALLALALGAPRGYWKQMGTLISPTTDYNYSSRDGRKALVERGIGYMALYPVFGLGIDNFARAECTVSPKLESLRRNGPVRCTPPHNSYVQAGAELGVPGLLVWSSLVFCGIVCPLRLRRRLPRSWWRGTHPERFIYAATTFFPLSMIGFAVTSFFVSFAWMDPVYLMAALLAGLYVSARAQLRQSASPLAVATGQSCATNHAPPRRGSRRWRGPGPLPLGAR